MRKKSLTRSERKRQIIIWFVIRIQNDNEDIASMYQIAKGIGVSPSTHLNTLIWELCAEGSLSCYELNRSGRWHGRGYMLTDGTFRRPRKETRKLKLNSAKGCEQLELF